MEGTVIGIGDDLVVKIWHRRTTGELEVLKSFYDAVARSDASFDAPRIFDVLTLDGQCATVETLLSGRPLRNHTGFDSSSAASPVGDDDVACVTDVLAALAAVETTADLGALPILADERPFRTEILPFAPSLAAVVQRRVERFRRVLSARLPELDVVTEAVVRRLNGLELGKTCLVHGDLIPANILVDDSTRPLAVLDFGFMTTIGDPAFDAAVTASIFDMYGPRAAETEAILDAAVAARFGYEPGRLAVYRAAYALVTSNCFSASGSDGHFEWCMRILECPEVHEALEL